MRRRPHSQKATAIVLTPKALLSLAWESPHFCRQVRNAVPSMDSKYNNVIY
jgi:hypothetical protein